MREIGLTRLGQSYSPMNRLFTLSYLLPTLYIFPVALHIGRYTEKTMDLVLSDLFILLLPFIVIVQQKKIKRADTFFVHLVVGLFCYYLILGIFGTLFVHHNFIAVISAIRFSKPLFSAIVGILLFSRRSMKKFPKGLITIIMIYPIILLLSDIVYSPHFPKPRWGGLLGAYRIYGFPNSAALFSVLFSCFLLIFVLLNLQKNRIYILFLLLYVVLAIMSLSRNAILSQMMVFIISYLLITKQLYIKLMIMSVMSLIIYGVWNFLLRIDYFYAINEALINRAFRTLDQADSIAGRLPIWLEAIDLILKKPLLGYMFEPFSYYHIEHATSHQQYLEILYKSGLIGFLLYAVIFGYGLRLCYVTYHAHPDMYIRWIAGSTFIAGLVILVSNFFQPNLSYSLTGNFIWLMIGIVVAAHNTMASNTLKTK